MTEINLNVNLAGIALDNPIVAASGPFGHGTEYSRLTGMRALGAITVKGISLEPWSGNRPPRLAETASGLLNAIGLQNPGLVSFLQKELPELKKLGVPLIINIAGSTDEEYAAVAAGLNDIGGISGLEINISCPNLKAGGISFGVDPEATYRVVRVVRKETDLPLLVKLSPNVTDITPIARAAEEAGADGLSLINTLSGMVIDLERKKPLLGAGFGGLSGPAIMPVALKMVWQAASAVNIPILGMGGITSASDAIQFILAGSRAVAIGTGIFYNPRLPGQIIDGIAAYMKNNGFTSIEQIEGLAHRDGDNNVRD